MSNLLFNSEKSHIKAWLNRAVALLLASLEQPRQELNELDWKLTLSPDKKRLIEHLSAYSNYPGGGFLIFRVGPDGTPVDMEPHTTEGIVLQLANLGRSSVECPITIDHAIATFRGARLLFVYIAESTVKPVHIRGKTIEDAFIRSGGTTRGASKAEVGTMLLHSKTPKWEELRASILISDDEIRKKLSVDRIFKMLERVPPTLPEEVLKWMEAEHFIVREPAGGGYVTNLGAIAVSKRISDFPELSRKAVRVLVYNGLNKANTRHQQEGTMGYAISFAGLLGYVAALLPQSEIIKSALRTTQTVYPMIALRELMANALIHQDFSVSGSGPMIEIYNDRIEISNPGDLTPEGWT